MAELDLQTKLNDVVDVMIGIDPATRTFPRSGWPFQVSKPNIHDNKSDFVEERDAVISAIGQARHLTDFITLAMGGGGVEVVEMNRRVTEHVDTLARMERDSAASRTIPSFILNGACDCGLSVSLLFLLLKYQAGLLARRRELSDQEDEFWSGSHRPPNHFARTIALRLARLYAVEMQKFPTVGVSADGGHPSTTFTRALEQVFELLGIRANVRNAASWAVAQLSDQDIVRPANALRGLMDYVAEQPPDALALLAAEVKEKGSRG